MRIIQDFLFVINHILIQQARYYVICLSAYRIASIGHFYIQNIQSIMLTYNFSYNKRTFHNKSLFCTRRIDPFAYIHLLQILNKQIAQHYRRSARFDEVPDLMRCQ